MKLDTENLTTAADALYRYAADCERLGIVPPASLAMSPWTISRALIWCPPDPEPETVIE